MKLLITFIAIILLASCNGEPAFRYNKQTACEINYGQNGISIIVDGDKVLIKNNRQLGFGNLVTVGTADRSYSTLGRYFHDSDINDFIESLGISKKIYIRWQNISDRVSSGTAFSTIINVSDFSQRFSNCVKSQMH